MKKLTFTTFSLLLIIALNGFGQTQIFSDNFSSSSNWTIKGVYAPPPNSPGTLSINSGILEYNDFLGGQTYRLIHDLTTPLNDNEWRIEFKYKGLPSTQDYVFTFYVSDDTSAFHSNCFQCLTSNQASGIHIAVNDALGPNNQLNAKLQGKYLTTRYAASQSIQVNKNTDYYFRVERLSLDKMILSVYSDASRQNHITGSPVCYDLDSRITGLRYLQFGVGTTAGSSRTANVEIEDLG